MLVVGDLVMVWGLEGGLEVQSVNYLWMRPDEEADIRCLPSILDASWRDEHAQYFVNSSE